MLLRGPDLALLLAAHIADLLAAFLIFRAFFSDFDRGFLVCVRGADGMSKSKPPVGAMLKRINIPQRMGFNTIFKIRITSSITPIQKVNI
jgi:hypothetical protein